MKLSLATSLLSSFLLPACLFAASVALPAAASGVAAPRWTTLGATAFKHTPSPLMGGRVIAQDHSGFLWLGTQSGLVRWDGYAVRRYTADSGQARALPDSFIRSVHVDRRGALWVGTSSGGMARYEAASDDFTVFKPGPGSVSDGNVTAFVDDGKGGLWIGTAGGLDHIDANGKLSAMSDKLLPPAGAGAPERAIEELKRDRGGALWIGTRKGLLVLRPGAKRAEPVNFEGSAEAAPPVSAVFEDSGGRVWIGTRNLGAFVVEPGAASAIVAPESAAAPLLSRQRIFSIVEVSPTEIWFGTEGGGVIALDPVTGYARSIKHHPDTPDSLYDNDAYALYRERSGVIVVGTTEAISIYDPRPQALVTLRETGLPAAGKLTIPSLLVRPDGRVWLGVAGGNVDIVDPQLGGVGRIAAGVPGGLPNGRVLAMVNGPDGSVFVGTQQGLYRVSADGKRVRQVVVPQRSPTAGAYALAMRDGVLWLGGVDGLWGLQFGADPAAPTVLRHERAALGDSRVSALLPLDGGAMWIGTRAGLAYLPAPGAALEVVPADTGANDGLLPGYTSSLSLDRRGRLWVSTFGRGIQVLESKDASGKHRFRRLETSHGLPDLSVNAVLPDRSGTMWASTDNGLARIDPDSFAVRTLDKSDGAHISQYWTNAAALGSEGELLFGGITGLTIVHPEKLKAVGYTAPVVVTDISLNDRALPPGPYNGADDAAQPAPEPIRIRPEGRERGFSLEFAALDYSAPERMRYSYRLAGFDSAWIPALAGTRRISYNNLPPGSYQLELRAAKGAGAWTPVRSVPVEAMPSWYQLAWVRVLGLLAAMAAVVAVVQLRTAYLRQRQAELEAMVEQRTAELRATQAQLEQFAYADPLTGLPNRRLFTDELRQMKAAVARNKTPFTLLLIDLDHFKQVNDTLGHDAGDALLVEVSRRLRLAVRETDRLARLGGDEFAVLLSNTDTDEDIALVAQRIVETVAEPIPFGVHSMKVGASIGAASCGADAGEVEDLYKQADLALYEAKHSGRNTWVRYREEEQACV